MLKRFSTLVGIIISLTLLIISTLYYPGGSQNDKNAIRFSWTKNYLCNLFDEKAVNGSDNPARIWAITGMFFLSLTIAVFFYRFSKKIPSWSGSLVLKYAGVFSMLSLFLAVSPLHDIMITIGDTGLLLCMFYLTVFIFKSKLVFQKFISIISLLTIYTCTFIYYTQNYLFLLPVMQNTGLLIVIIWLLTMEHFTSAENFQVKKNMDSNRFYSHKLFRTCE